MRLGSEKCLLPVRRMFALQFCFWGIPTRLLLSWMLGSGREDWVCNEIRSWSLFMYSNVMPSIEQCDDFSLLTCLPHSSCRPRPHRMVESSLSDDCPRSPSQGEPSCCTSHRISVSHTGATGQLSIVTNNQQLQQQNTHRTCQAVGFNQTILLWDWIVSIDDWPIPYLAFHPEPWLPESGDWGHRALEQCSADQPWLTSSRLVVIGWWHLNINDD